MGNDTDWLGLGTGTTPIPIELPARAQVQLPDVLDRTGLSLGHGVQFAKLNLHSPLHLLLLAALSLRT